MCAMLWIVLVVPLRTYLADINIELHLGDNINETTLQAFGSIDEFIPEPEREAWSINDWQLREAALAHSERQPRRVYVRKTTTFNGPFERHRQQQVARSLKLIAARIVKITNGSDVYVTEELYNNGNSTQFYETKISHQIVQSISSSWTVIGGQLTLGRKINHNVFFNVGKNDSGGFSYKSVWGVNKNETKTDTVGVMAYTLVEIPPKHNVKGVLSMSRRTLQLQVDYRASLTGDVACRFKDNPNFVYYPVNTLLNLVGAPTVFMSSEKVTIEYFADLKITYTNQVTSELVAVVQKKLK